MRTSTEISKLKLNVEEVQRNFTEKEAELETERCSETAAECGKKNGC